MSRPLWGHPVGHDDPACRRRFPPWRAGEPPTKVGGLRGDILFKSKEYPLALPKKDSRGDGVVTSFISLAAAKRAPAHAFRRSSFSHRKRCAGLRREPCFPPGTPLKRPKGAAAPFGNPCSETDGGVFLRWDGGRRMRAGCLRSCRVFWVAGDEVWGGLVDLEAALGVPCLWSL